ncbi:MAG: 16S rRNA (cytosine(1402)-N(4))-methyltransferase, partial [Acidibacter sp.]|nr:16S rRNA (cytosine(1402)-N(4))-methyltransferase [Acidibacter sp.]
MDEHIPVLVDEVLEVLAPSAGGFYVDGTFGRGGHTARLLQAVGASGSVLALDRDPQAIAAGHQRFHDEPRLELGVSSPQIDDPSRGFSFSKDGPLDMRMDPTRGESAADFVARADERELFQVIAELGEERHARRIAR